jgi:hypothetical protein
MAKYWCRFFDENNQVVRAERMVAVDDITAVSNARAAAAGLVARFEVWRNVNFIHEESRIVETDRRPGQLPNV